jgi:catechol 2,3-dioxygenase-like lactoylglutathione lyase family enzyme
MEHVGIVVDDLDSAIAFFEDLGLELQGRQPVGGAWVDRIIGLEGVRADVAMLETPDGHGRVELSTFRSPTGAVADRHQPANVPGLRHLAFSVDDVEALVARLQDRGVELVGELVRYEDVYLLCYVRGPEGIIVELAQELT